MLGGSIVLMAIIGLELVLIKEFRKKKQRRLTKTRSLTLSDETIDILETIIEEISNF
jgi:hypothetical protein